MAAPSSERRGVAPARASNAAGDIGPRPAGAATAGLLGLRAAVSLDSYIAHPIGRCFAGKHAAAFCASAEVSGISFWGRPDERDMDVIVSAVKAVASRSIGSHLSVVDLRKLDCLDLRAFDRLWAALASCGAASGPMVTRRAVIIRPGPTGTIVAELFNLLTPACAGSSFDDAVEALSWLGVDHYPLSTDLERIDQVARAVSLIPDLQRVLDRRPGSKAEAAARALGVSQRTFQRRLRELGTTFQHEANQARVRAAKRLMRETNRPLKWIAIESGYASAQHFSAAFRACVGMSPGRWRHGNGA